MAIFFVLWHYFKRELVLFVVQLADFGLSTTFGHGHLLKTYCGSPLYASPEIVNARPYIGPEVSVCFIALLSFIAAQLLVVHFVLYFCFYFDCQLMADSAVLL